MAGKIGKLTATGIGERGPEDWRAIEYYMTLAVEMHSINLDGRGAPR